MFQTILVSKPCDLDFQERRERKSENVNRRKSKRRGTWEVKPVEDSLRNGCCVRTCSGRWSSWQWKTRRRRRERKMREKEKRWEFEVWEKQRLRPFFFYFCREPEAHMQRLWSDLTRATTVAEDLFKRRERKRCRCVIGTGKDGLVNGYSYVGRGSRAG